MKQFQALKKLAEKVLDQAIIDVLKQKNVSKEDLFFAKYFLENEGFLYGDILELTEKDIKKRIEEKKQEILLKKEKFKERHSKPVICIETKRIYQTIREAEICEGHTTIGRCCKGLIESVAGQHWMFLDEYQKEFEN